MTTDTEDLVACDHCGGRIDPENVHLLVCSDLRVCDSCITNARSVVGRPLFVHCEEEGGYAFRRNVVQAIDSNEYATESHASDNWYRSDQMGGWYASSDARYEAERDADPDHIYGYHDIDVIEAHGWPKETPADSLCMGVELEMEHANDSDQEGQEALSEALGGRDGNGRYVLMTDGSLDDSGVEMVTLPYTLDGHRTVFRWESVLAPVVRIGRAGTGTSRCGMHVHVNRRAALLTPLTVGKLLVFINRADNSVLIETVAQRAATSYARRYAKKVADGLCPEEAQGERYEALNFTRRTIEFRIFRGNLRADRVYKNLEFVEASIRFCADSAVSTLSTAAFLAWLTKRQSQYKNLYRFLVEKRMIDDKRAGRIARAQEA